MLVTEDMGGFCCVGHCVGIMINGDAIPLCFLDFEEGTKLLVGDGWVVVMKMEALYNHCVEVW